MRHNPEYADAVTRPRFWCAVLAIWLAALAAMPASAQTPPVAPTQQKMTLGEMLDRGAKRLSPAEMRSLIAGATISGVQGGNFPDVTYTNVYSSDGAVAGNAWKSKVWFTKIKGTWSVNDSGQLCVDLMNDRQEKVAGCQSLYVLEGRYYATRSDARDAEANWRTLSR